MIINNEHIIASRHQEEVLNSVDPIDTFVVSDEHRREEVTILYKWKDYFDHYNVPYIITKVPENRVRKGMDVIIHKLILWKIMPYRLRSK